MRYCLLACVLLFVDMNESVFLLLRQQLSRLSMHALREQTAHGATCSDAMREAQRTKRKYIHDMSCTCT